jgi:hypothetical protein
MRGGSGAQQGYGEDHAAERLREFVGKRYPEGLEPAETPMEPDEDENTAQQPGSGGREAGSRSARTWTGQRSARDGRGVRRPPAHRGRPAQPPPARAARCPTATPSPSRCRAPRPPAAATRRAAGPAAPRQPPRRLVADIPGERGQPVHPHVVLPGASSRIRAGPTRVRPSTSSSWPIQKVNSPEPCCRVRAGIRRDTQGEADLISEF